MQPKDTQPSTIDMARGLGLSAEEFKYICQKLERAPNFAELGVFSAMYSEHCSYKSSRHLLKRLPTQGKRVLQGPGENAGILDIGEGYAIVFKMESHNHPSFIEPFQGAATGVGGILRDIFTMGARPIASMDALCFGTEPNAKNLSVVRGVVKGIGDYGNSVGVPTVAGQTFFHPCYNLNPLVNAFTLGIIKKDCIYRGIAQGTGNLVIYVGAKTGRDGVHGATMASREFSTDSEPERPTVQVGDPFTEKLLLEATLEAMKERLMVGIQDMGAAGLTSSSFEMASRGKVGLAIDLDKIPTREGLMTAYELLLSESQERMLLVTTPELFPRLAAVYQKWDLHAAVIGTVTEGHRINMTKNDVTVIDLPVDLVTTAPTFERVKPVPNDMRQLWFIDRNRMLLASMQEKCQALLDDPNFFDATPIVEQYDSTVGARTLGSSFDDAALIRLREIENKTYRLALSVDCNPRVSSLYPREGARRAVSEGAINVAMRAAEPIGITDCLNFGSPENPEVMWQFEESIEGICEACEKLKIPVISGNVSFYNDTDKKPIYPTPMIGMVGLSEGEYRIPHSAFFGTQLEIGLLGVHEAGLGGSAFASQWFKRDSGKPDDTDLQAVERMLRFLLKLRSRRFEYACHDISDGGLMVSALEMAFRAPHSEVIGVDISIPFDTEPDKFLFGETIPRVLINYESSERTDIENFSAMCGVPFHWIGTTNDTGLFTIRQGGAKLFEKEIKLLKQEWQKKTRVFFDGA